MVLKFMKDAARKASRRRARAQKPLPVHDVFAPLDIASLDQQQWTSFISDTTIVAGCNCVFCHVRQDLSNDTRRHTLPRRSRPLQANMTEEALQLPPTSSLLDMLYRSSDPDRGPASSRPTEPVSLSALDDVDDIALALQLIEMWSSPCAVDDENSVGSRLDADEGVNTAFDDQLSQTPLLGGRFDELEKPPAYSRYDPAPHLYARKQGGNDSSRHLANIPYSPRF